MHASPSASGHWSLPRLVSEDAPPAVAQFPSVAVGAGVVYVVGNQILFDAQPVVESPLVSLILGGKGIGRPEGRFHFVMPKAVVDDAGRLHLLWAEPPGEYEQINSDLWPPYRLTSIWTAVYVAGTGWTPPRRLYDGKQFFWDHAPIASGFGILDSATGARRRDDRIGIAVSTFTGERGQPQIYLHLRDGGWILGSIPTTTHSGGVFPTLVANGEQLYLAFLGADPNAQSDINSVIFQRSTDGGKTWSASHVVSRSGDRPARAVQVIVEPTGAIHLFWLQSATGEGTVLRHAMSRDDGRSWSPPDDYGTAVERHNLRAVIDSRNVMHVVWENWAEGPHAIRLEHTTWNGRWSAPHQLFAGWRSYTPALVLSERGLPLLVSIGNRASAPIEAVPHTLYSEFTP